MAEVIVVVGSVGLLAAGSVAWCTMWRRRAAALQRVPATARPTRAVRPAAERPGGTA
jgi:hypothetical protein